MVVGLRRVIAISFLILALAATLVGFRPFFGNFEKPETVRFFKSDATPTDVATAEEEAKDLASAPNTQMPEEDVDTDLMTAGAHGDLAIAISYEAFYVSHTALFPIILPLESPPPRA